MKRTQTNEGRHSEGRYSKERRNEGRRSHRSHRRGVTSDDGLIIAIEMVATPLVFAAAGFGIDSWLGTRPWFTAILGIVAFTGKVVSEWYRYTSRMDKHQEEIVGSRPTQSRGLRRPQQETGLQIGPAAASTSTAAASTSPVVADGALADSNSAAGNSISRRNKEQ